MRGAAHRSFGVIEIETTDVVRCIGGYPQRWNHIVGEAPDTPEEPRRTFEARVGPLDFFLGRRHEHDVQPQRVGPERVDELERVVREYGFKAVEIGTSIEGAQLAEQRFRPVLRRAQELGVFVFAHPYYVGAKTGLECYYLTNLVGNPLDTTVMLANLMFSGALDELDELRLCLAHGGGFAPYQIGRLVHGHRVRAEALAVHDEPRARVPRLADRARAQRPDRRTS